MIENGLWQPKLLGKLKVHPLRPRRAKLGELIQLDESDHDWFEGRGPRCTLLVFIDDATSATLHLKFAKTPASPQNAHRPLLEVHNLDKIFCLKFECWTKKLCIEKPRKTIGTIEKFCSSAAKLRSCSIVFLGCSMHDFLFSIEVQCIDLQKSWLFGYSSALKEAR